MLLLFFGLAPVVFSQNLDEYLAIAADNNPELKAYFNEYLAAMEKVPQAGALPDPELSIGFFIRPMERFMGNQQADIQLMQMFPWFGMLRAREDEASQMAFAQFEVFQDTKNRLFYQVKATWYEMYRLKEEIRITEETLEILKKYERLALIRFQSAGIGASSGSGNMDAAPAIKTQSSTSSGGSMGGMSGGMNSSGKSGSSGGTNNTSMNSSGAMGSTGSGMSDVLRVRLEIREVENTLALLRDSRVPLQAEFNQLLNRNINESVAISDTLTVETLSLERAALLDSITHNNPMLKMLDAEEKVYVVQKKMAIQEGRPMLGAGVNYMPFSPREDGMAMGGNDMVMPMVRFTVPIYRKKYSALEKEAELRQLAVQQRRQNTVNQLSTQWASTMRDLNDAVRRAELYRGQADLAQQTLNLLMTSYSVEGRDFEEVLRVQQQLLNYRLKLINAVVDQHTTIATLENLAAIELN